MINNKVVKDVVLEKIFICKNLVIVDVGFFFVMLSFKMFVFVNIVFLKLIIKLVIVRFIKR